MKMSMKKTNDPDGPLHKWGEPEGVEDYKNKTPGQGKMKSFKEIQQESKDEVFTSLDHKINGKDHDTRMRDSWKNIHKIAGDLQREKKFNYSILIRKFRNPYTQKEKKCERKDYNRRNQ